MRIAFTGDISFHNIDKYTDDPFKYICSELSKLNCVINLESVFLPKSYKKDPIKEKICLRQDEYCVKYLKRLNPLLVTLSNNHINDFGNFGVIKTKQILEKENIHCFGAGKITEDHNVFSFKEEKILFLSYTTRNTDLSWSILFNEKDFMGPKELSIELFKKQIDGYEDYIKIILLHWGVEFRHYPLPEQRIIAKKLIDMGVDLIIGNHSHVIQSYEKYKGKWIFYSLGNFLLPDYTYKYIAKKSHKVCLFPVFDVENQKVNLQRLHYVGANEQFELSFKNKNMNYKLFLFANYKLYRVFYLIYKVFFEFKKKIGWPLRKFKILCSIVGVVKKGDELD